MVCYSLEVCLFGNSIAIMNLDSKWRTYFGLFVIVVQNAGGMLNFFLD